MTIFNICWVMSVIIWAIFFIASMVSAKVYVDSKLSFIFNICQFIMIVFIWGFLLMGA